jgi:hypothetical protein
MRLRPETAPERLALLMEQPHKAAEAIANFSQSFEELFGLSRD